MTERASKCLSRRDLLGKAAVLMGLAPFARRGNTPWTANYETLDHEAAAFAEALVNTLCPADDSTPNGVECGLVAFIDRQLAGEFGAQLSWRAPLSKAELFEEGAHAANAAARGRYGVRLDQMLASEAGVFVAAVASGRVTESELPLASWYGRIVKPLLVQASFSGPIYGRYGNRVFTKLF